MTKSKEVTRIGGIATLCNDGQQHHPPTLLEQKKVFCILKEDFDRMRRQQEKKNTIGKFALVSQGNH